MDRRARGLPLFKRLTDDHGHRSNRGEHRWMVANGDGPRSSGDQGFELPPLGNPGRSAPLVTRTLLFIGQGRSHVVKRAAAAAGMPSTISPGYGGTGSRRWTRQPCNVWSMDLPAGRRARDHVHVPGQAIHRRGGRDDQHSPNGSRWGCRKNLASPDARRRSKSWNRASSRSTSSGDPFGPHGPPTAFSMACSSHRSASSVSQAPPDKRMPYGCT